MLRRPIFWLNDKFSKAFSPIKKRYGFLYPFNIGILIVPNFSTIIWGKGHISIDLCKNKVIMACLKKRMVDSTFTNYIRLVTKYWVNARRSATKKVSRFIEVKESNYLPAFKFTSPAHSTPSIKVSNKYQAKRWCIIYIW